MSDLAGNVEAQTSRRVDWIEGEPCRLGSGSEAAEESGQLSGHRVSVIAEHGRASGTRDAVRGNAMAELNRQTIYILGSSRSNVPIDRSTSRESTASPWPPGQAQIRLPRRPVCVRHSGCPNYARGRRSAAPMQRPRPASTTSNSRPVPLSFRLLHRQPS